MKWSQKGRKYKKNITFSGPRPPFMLMQQQPQVSSNGGCLTPGAGSPVVSSTNGFLQNFHQSVVGDLRAGNGV